MLLEGGRANHAAIIYAPEGSEMKYVVDCPSTSGVFNEQPGAAMTELNEWLGRALAQDYDLVWLPLSKNVREKGNLDEASLL